MRWAQCWLICFFIRVSVLHNSCTLSFQLGRDQLTFSAYASILLPKHKGAEGTSEPFCLDDAYSRSLACQAFALVAGNAGYPAHFLAYAPDLSVAHLLWYSTLHCEQLLISSCAAAQRAARLVSLGCY